MNYPLNRGGLLRCHMDGDRNPTSRTLVSLGMEGSSPSSIPSASPSSRPRPRLDEEEGRGVESGKAGRAGLSEGEFLLRRSGVEGSTLPGPGPRISGSPRGHCRRGRGSLRTDLLTSVATRVVRPRKGAHVSTARGKRPGGPRHRGSGASQSGARPVGGTSRLVRYPVGRRGNGYAATATPSKPISGKHAALPNPVGESNPCLSLRGIAHPSSSDRRRPFRKPWPRSTPNYVDSHHCSRLTALCRNQLLLRRMPRPACAPSMRVAKGRLVHGPRSS
jgi:hypothetical protein